MENPNANTEVQFLTIEEFKSKIGAESAQILKNPNTGKLFLAASNGENFKVQQEINPKEEMKILVPDGDISEACLTNVKPGAEVIAQL
mgnify:CR=1 FL=1